MYDINYFCDFFNYMVAGHFFHFKLFYFCLCSLASGTATVTLMGQFVLSFALYDSNIKLQPKGLLAS